MKKLLLSFLLACTAFSSFASHIVGGEMIYEYNGPGASPNTKNYKITLHLFRDNLCTACAGMPPDVFIGIYNLDSNTEYSACPTVYCDVPLSSQNIVPVNPFPPCVVNAPTLDYRVGNYSFTVDLPNNVNGYSAAYQTCCRVNPIQNIANSPGVGGTGSTYSCVIPPIIDNSPQFTTNISLVCQNRFFTFDFSASDNNGDSLVYFFCDAYNGGLAQNSSNINPAAPPYQPVTYINGFTGSKPLGNAVTINSQTGLISGIAPGAGEYVVCVCVNSYKNGVFVGVHKKDFIINIGSCDFAGAQLNPKPVTCNGFTVQFTNDNSSPLNQTFFWDFGVPGISSDTSTLPNPIYTYADSGVYIYKLVVNRGQPCGDSASQTLRVYPGFFPGFKWSGLCTGKPVQFTDTSKTNYGIIDTWRWDFGNTATLGDTSHLQNPSYTYPVSGNYNVNFIVSNSKGCRDTINKIVPIVDNPTLATLFRDTTYCGKDTIQLHTSSTLTGNYTWTPAVNIIGANTSDPFVFPTTTTTYRVNMNSSGCIATDSVNVRPKLDLATSVNANPTNICEEDTTTLSATANHSPVQFMWSPPGSVLSPSSPVTKAFPASTTSYTMFVKWGNNCIVSNSTTITVKPLATPNAGRDTAFCPRTNGVLLNASGGDNYTWRPPGGLSATNIPNPRATPNATTLYIVSVGVSGCAKRREDSVLITVSPLPPLSVTNDTLICSFVDTLQLNAMGTGNIFWTPNYNISNQNSPSPLVSPRFTTKYYATITNSLGCINIDSVLVNVKDSVILYAGNDTSICRTDTIKLNPVSDALHYLWTPGQPVLNNDTAKYPTARPLNTTTFHLIGNIGKCQSEGFVTIKVGPYPIANAGGDTTICFGDTARLNAAGGSFYKWSPPYFLNNPNIQHPLSATKRNIRYIVSVTDTLGCPKAVNDTVLVKVYPKIIADAGPRDTSIVINQPLQLQASGGLSYLWKPPINLSDPNISNPVALFRNITDASIDYIVTVSTATCSATDTITVKVYKILPGLYVPNAFTPNGDGINDVFRPIPLGMKSILYFQVFNRWGQLMFSTTEQMKGWNGRFKGKPQDPATYVWIVAGLDHQGIIIRQKGIVVLIR